MSAKWRRSKKNPKHFNIFKAFSKMRDKSSPQVSRFKNPKNKRKTCPRAYRIARAYPEKKMREPSPLIDILEEEDGVIIVAELAGFSKENLKIRVKDQRITLSAQTTDRKYYKSLNLPKRVIPNTIRTTYKNGVLEIQLKKAAEEKTIDNVAG